ncbi:hypothetical protein Zmor_019855 [Zophobas morio]|uniref:Ricin B lectin domain-containing protein n=1 Tax=Zophobas morio TaxID=2755281 RepID=A0AA38M908_9CUCU|nr:hypothetical protein Zmor_019173 [Zophobas morio]KAJ3648019.1 hypothetical protein Zmor_019855 [Zophobas morio]
MASNHRQVRKVLLFLLISSLKVIFTHDCDHEDLYIIRSAIQYGLVLDGTDHNYIKIQPFAGFCSQFWKMETASRAGLFYIVNKCTGTVLDVEYVDAIGTWKTLLKKKNGSMVQQWVLKENGRIMNAEKLYNLDIFSAGYTIGNTVNIWKDNGNGAQEYILQRTPSCHKGDDYSQHL